MRSLFTVVLTALLFGCAAVPKESVELSTTVGRDIAEVERSHRALVSLYYDQMESSVDRFVENVYAPYMIEKTLGDPEIGGELAMAIADSAKPAASAQTKKDTLEAMGHYFQSVRDNIEQFREKLKAPLRQQRAQLTSSLDDAYIRIKEGNAVVTGYLASVVRVKDEQNHLLASVGAPNLQTTIAGKADALSRKLETVIQDARKGKQTLSTAVEEGEKVLKSME